MSKDYMWRYWYSFLTSCILFFTYLLYVSILGWNFDILAVLYIVEYTVITLIGSVLLIGVLCRVYDVFDRWMIYRKELGVVAMYGAFLSTVIRIYVGGRIRYYDLQYYYYHLWDVFIPGIAILTTSFFLFLISRKPIQSYIGMKSWWFGQNWGMRFLGLLALYFIIMNGKFEWFIWVSYSLKNVLPPLSLLIGGFMSIVFIVRCLEDCFRAQMRWIIPGISLLFIALLVGLSLGKMM